jgi:hypothetical protein
MMHKGKLSGSLGEESEWTGFKPKFLSVWVKERMGL